MHDWGFKTVIIIIVVDSVCYYYHDTMIGDNINTTVYNARVCPSSLQSFQILSLNK